MNKLIISAPFGNYLDFKYCTRTYGTFTWEARPGRLLQVLRTVRYNWRQQSWINKIGLRNPGIKSLEGQSVDGIISIHGFDYVEWYSLVNFLIFRTMPICGEAVQYVEFNLSCPNVNHKPDVKEVQRSIELCLKYNRIPICKIPPVRWVDYIIPLYDIGVRWFHCCNTIPTPGGGISGKPLKQYSLWCIEDFRSAFSDVKIIGGGGITTTEDIKDYKRAGADYFAVGSYCINPFNWKRIKELAIYANGV